MGCSSKPEKGDPLKFKQYYFKGEELYLQHCSNCHQADGKGLGLLYPPLSQSDYLKGRQREVACLIKYGIDGELIVNGQQYNKPMPGIPSLTNLEIAEISTYIYNTWGAEEGLIDVLTTNAYLDSCLTK